jgi:hypothetical protein
MSTARPRHSSAPTAPDGLQRQETAIVEYDSSVDQEIPRAKHAGDARCRS